MNKKTGTENYVRFFAIATFMSVTVASLFFLSRQARRPLVVYIPQHSDYWSNFSTSIAHSLINFSTSIAHFLINFSTSFAHRCITFEIGPNSHHSFKFFDFKFNGVQVI